MEERTRGTFPIPTDETAPFLGSRLLLPWTCDWSTALDLSLLDQCPTQDILELGLELEEKPLHADLEAMVWKEL